MIIVLIIVGLVVGVYSLMIVYFAWRWVNLPPNPLSNASDSISNKGEEKAGTEKNLLSVIVVFRNEEKHLSNLITDLAGQDLHKDFWEILWVDDFSDDKSLEIVQKSQNTLPNSQILRNDEFLHILSPKKRGITQAISKAKGKWIVCTDADCRVPTSWLSTILDYFQQSGAYFVSMPVKFETNQHFFSQWQAVELASLIGTGAVCISLHKPTMCNGANIAYRKAIFEQVGGFSGSEHIPSGDDEFLMHKIAKNFPKKVQFLKFQSVLVSTQPNATFAEFFHQRKRWASKWEHYENHFAKMLAIFIFLVNLSVLILPIWFFEKTWVVFSLLVFKFVAEFVFLTCILDFFKQKWLALWIPILFVLYPFYAVFFALAGRSKGYQWKNRHYERT